MPAANVDIHAAARRHCSRDTHDALVLAGKLQKRIAKHARKRRVRIARSKWKPAFRVKCAATVILRRILFGSVKTATLFGQHVNKARALLLLDAFKNHHEFIDVVTINRTKVADAEVFKEATRLHGVLRRILDLQEEVTEAGTQNARQTIHQAIQVRTHLVVNRVRNHSVRYSSCYRSR